MLLIMSMRNFQQQHVMNEAKVLLSAAPLLALTTEVSN